MPGKRKKQGGMNMDGYCPRCGKPLPEDGVCDCAAQPKPAGGSYVPPYYSAPRPLGAALTNLPSLIVGYLKNPIGTSRLAMEKRDTASAVLMMILTVVVSFFTCLLLTVRYSSGRFGRIAIEWALTGLAAPLAAFGVTFGVLYLMVSLAGVRTDSRRMLALMGVNTLLPLVFMVLSMVLSMVHLAAFEIFTVMIYGAWIVSFLMMMVHGLGIRLNVINSAVLVCGMTVGYFLVNFLRGWLVAGLA